MENIWSLCSNTSNVDLWLEYTILSDHSGRGLVLLFIVRECSIQINGQSLNWDSINTWSNILPFSRVMFLAIRTNALSFLYTLRHIYEIWFSKFNSESIETSNSVSVLLDLTETPLIFISIEDLEFKVGLSPSKKNLCYLLDWKPFKSDEKCFLFFLNPLSDMFSIPSWYLFFWVILTVPSEVWIFCLFSAILLVK